MSVSILLAVDYRFPGFTISLPFPSALPASTCRQGKDTGSSLTFASLYSTNVLLLQRKRVVIVSMAKAKGRMVRRSSTEKPGASRVRSKLTTTVTFSAADLSILGECVAAGMLMLRMARSPKAVSKLKAAMSRLGVSVARGL